MFYILVIADYTVAFWRYAIAQNNFSFLLKFVFLNDIITPITNNRVTSPPWNPVASVIDVNSNLIINT